MSLTIISIVKFAMETEVALNMQNWPARPQVHLIVSSVIRGIGMRIQIAGNDDEIDKIRTPIFPYVTSLFIARSLHIMRNPSDPMYSSINGFYLRLGKNGGAFKVSESLCE